MVNKLDRAQQGASRTLAVRVPATLLDALDAEVDRLKSLRPGARIDRSDVVRELLGTALKRGGDPDPESRAHIDPVGLLAQQFGKGSADRRSTAERKSATVELLLRGLTFVLAPAGDEFKSRRDRLEMLAHGLLAEIGPTLRQDDRVWFNELLDAGPRAVRMAAATVVTHGVLTADATNIASSIGDTVGAATKREIVLLALRANGWNLARTARELRAGERAAPVLRLIRDLGLTSEYERAQQRGLAKRGRPKKYT